MAFAEFLTENFGTILGMLGIGGGASIFSIYYTRQQAKADISQSVQDVYQEMLDDLKRDRADLREEIVGLRKEVAELRSLLPLICKRSDCPTREIHTDRND